MTIPSRQLLTGGFTFCMYIQPLDLSHQIFVCQSPPWVIGTPIQVFDHLKEVVINFLMGFFWTTEDRTQKVEYRQLQLIINQDRSPFFSFSDISRAAPVGLILLGRDDHTFQAILDIVLRYLFHSAKDPSSKFVSCGTRTFGIGRTMKSTYKCVLHQRVPDGDAI